MNIYSVKDKSVTGKLETDFYVPVTIRFEQNDKRPRAILMYRIKNSKSSFIEFCINSSNKKLVRLTTVTINSINRNQIIDNLPGNIEKGNPDFNLSLFKDTDIITDNTDFDVYLQRRKLTVLLDSLDKINTKIEMDYVTFLTDKQNKMIGLQFRNFSEDQWVLVCDSIKSHIKYAGLPSKDL